MRIERGMTSKKLPVRAWRTVDACLRIGANNCLLLRISMEEMARIKERNEKHAAGVPEFYAIADGGDELFFWPPADRRYQLLFRYAEIREI